MNRDLTVEGALFYFSFQYAMGLFDYRIRIRIYNESEPKVNPTNIRHAKSVDLPSESEPSFTVNPDPDPMIE